MSTAFVTNNFVGGAIGSAAASVLWSAGGWGAVMAAAVVASLFALVVWALGRRGPLVVEAPRWTNALADQGGPSRAGDG